MATLTLSYNDSYFPYAIIRRQSDNYVWNGATFAAWSDGSIGTYDLVMASVGGDLYSVDFPDDIDPGNYIVMYYEALSYGTPAITDLHFPLDDYFHWTGQALESESSVDISDYALTTLEGVKRHMRITTSGEDTLLTELINQVSLKIERICGCRFKARDYQRWLNTRGEVRLVLPDAPVQHVTRISYGSIQTMTARYSGSGIRANISVYVNPESAAAGGVRVVSYSTSGVRTANNFTFSDYPTTGLMTAAIDALSGWAASATRATTSFDLRPSGSTNALSVEAVLNGTVWDTDEYRADLPRGIVSFDRRAGGWGCQSAEFDFAHQDMLIEYRAGYETIPADVDLVARELVKESYFAGRQNSGVKATKLGPYSIEFNDNQEKMVRSRLAMYMDAGALVGGGA